MNYFRNSLIALLTIVSLAIGASPSRAQTTATIKLPDAYVGTPYSYTYSGHTLEVALDPKTGIYSPEIGGIPSGLLLDGSSDLTGIPTSAGTYTYSIEIYGAAFQAVTYQAFTITVNPITPQSGIYYDPTQAGSGWSMQVGPAGNIYLAGFGYSDDGSGHPDWLVATLFPVIFGGSPITFSGSVSHCTGGTPFTTAVTAQTNALPNCTSYQADPTATLSFTGNTTAQLTIGPRVANLVAFTSF